MPHTGMIFSVSEMTGPFKGIKDKEQKRFLAESAASTLKRSSEIKADVKTIKGDKELLAAAKEILREEVAASKKALSV